MFFFFGIESLHFFGRLCSSVQPSLGVQQHGVSPTSNGSGLLSNISVPAAVVGGAGLFVVWRLISHGRGSANVLIERGLTEDPRERGTENSIKVCRALCVGADSEWQKLFRSLNTQDSMKGVKTMDIPELSEDQILANRERRRRQLADYMPPEFTQEEKAAMESNGNGAAKVDSDYELDVKNDNIEVLMAVLGDMGGEEEINKHPCGCGCEISLANDIILTVS